MEFPAIEEDSYLTKTSGYLANDRLLLKNIRNVLSEVAPEWVRAYVPIEWVERNGERLKHERLPKEEEERKQYANQVGADG